MSRKIEFAMITAPRGPMYLQDTIGSLRDTSFFEDKNHLPLRLICSSKFDTNDPRLNAYRGDTNLSLEETEKKWRTVSAEPDPPVHNAEFARDLGFNTRRAFLGLTKSRSSHLCLFEDDIKFCKGWLARLHETITDIEKTYRSQWILTLFDSKTDGSVKMLRDTLKWYVSPERPHVGNLAIVYPRDVALTMAPAIMNRCILSYKLPMDFLLGQWADENKIPLIASVPSLVQHMGRFSSMCNPDGVTLSFVEDIT